MGPNGSARAPSLTSSWVARLRGHGRQRESRRRRAARPGALRPGPSGALPDVPVPDRGARGALASALTEVALGRGPDREAEAGHSEPVSPQRPLARDRSGDPRPPDERRSLRRRGQAQRDPPARDLHPRFAVLDELDSGLDVDALGQVARRIERATRRRSPPRRDRDHPYRRLLAELPAQRVHVLSEGRIVASGGPELAEELERTGYVAYREEALRPISAGGGGASAPTWVLGVTFPGGL